MRKYKLNQLLINLLLFLGSMVIVFVLIESAYRLLDPFPYFAPFEVNMTEHGNLTQYDRELGWSGIPSSQERFVTVNSAVTLQHNQSGHRDIEQEMRSQDNPAIVFLGDSFTWGYEVEWEEMFVSRLRYKLTGYELYNIGHRGYGTDQELLIFRRWREGNSSDIKLVILMFSGNDIGENSSSFRYKKEKPKFQVVEDELVLTNVPVPYIDRFNDPLLQRPKPTTFKQRLKYRLLQSHFLHDVYYRIGQIIKKYGNAEQKTVQGPPEAERVPLDTFLTERILQQLRDEVIAVGAKLIVIAIPSKIEFITGRGGMPYQKTVESMCKVLGIPYLDLAPPYKDAFFRPYFKMGYHWNAYGHKLAAEAIISYLEFNEYID